MDMDNVSVCPLCVQEAVPDNGTSTDSTRPGQAPWVVRQETCKNRPKIVPNGDSLS